MSNHSDADLAAALYDLGIEVQPDSSTLQSGGSTIVPAFLQTREVEKFNSLLVQNRDALFQPHDGIHYFQPAESEEVKDEDSEDIMQDIDEYGNVMSAVEEVAGVDSEEKERVLFEAIQTKTLELEARNIMISAVPIAQKVEEVHDPRHGVQKMQKVLQFLRDQAGVQLYCVDTSKSLISAFRLRVLVLVACCRLFHSVECSLDHFMHVKLLLVGSAFFTSAEADCLRDIPCWALAATWEDVFLLVGYYAKELNLGSVNNVKECKNYIFKSVLTSLPTELSLPYVLALLGEAVAAFRMFDVSGIKEANTTSNAVDPSFCGIQRMLNNMNWSNLADMNLQKESFLQHKQPENAENTSYQDSHVYKQLKGAFTEHQLYKELQHACTYHAATSEYEDNRDVLHVIPVVI